MVSANTDELLNTAQTARLFGVGISTVSKWKMRHKDFPDEVLSIRVVRDNRQKTIQIKEAGLRWRSQLETWGREHDKL